MAETRSDKLADEFDSLRLEVLDVVDYCDRQERAALGEYSRSAYRSVAIKLRDVLSAHEQKNVPPVRKGS